MRNFNQRFRLRDSDRHIRLLYTLFLLLMLAGFLFSFFWAHSMTGSIAIRALPITIEGPTPRSANRCPSGNWQR